MAERTIDHAAVRHQSRRLLRLHQAAPEGAWLHGEVARRMAERLALIRLKPARVLEWSAGVGASEQVLDQACPGATRTAVEPDADWATWLRRHRQPAWWSPQRWTGSTGAVIRRADPLPQANMQLVWANMSAHAEPDPPATMARWHDALEVGGFVMFSCLGPGTLAQLRSVYSSLGWGPPGADFVDMHDLGDMLLEAGFADPVMDQETLTLTWATPAALVAELRSLGGNVHPQRWPGLRTPRWREQLHAALAAGLAGADGRLQLTFEVAYGHAFKVRPRPVRAGETTVSLEEMRGLLRTSKPVGDVASGLR